MRKSTLHKIGITLGFIFTTAIQHAYAYGGGVALYDPLLTVTNQSNQAYTLEWYGATTDTIKHGLDVQVQNQGTANIAPNSHKQVQAHFLTLNANSTVLEKTNVFYVALYDQHAKKVTETKVIRHTLQDQASILAGNIAVVINRQGQLTLIFDTTTESKALSTGQNSPAGS